MKKIIALLAVLGMTVAAFAQQALGPGTGLVSPEINPDHSVTFRLFAPKAKMVQLTGDFLPTRPIEYEMGGQKLTYDAPGIVDLKEGRDGVWTWTSTPLDGELYSYSFLWMAGRPWIHPTFTRTATWLPGPTFSRSAPGRVTKAGIMKCITCRTARCHMSGTTARR